MSNPYLDREFMIFNVSELNQIDFNTVMETSINTVRKSVDKTKTFVKWEGDVPACVGTLTTKSDYFTLEEKQAVSLYLKYYDSFTEENINEFNGNAPEFIISFVVYTF